jgi:hypothetical protein
MLGFAFLIGFGVCIFSFLCGIALVVMDRYAEKVDGTTFGKVVSEDEKFRFSDIKTFNRSFWIICVSCVIIYCGIFPFL